MDRIIFVSSVHSVMHHRWQFCAWEA